MRPLQVSDSEAERTPSDSEASDEARIGSTRIGSLSRPVPDLAGLTHSDRSVRLIIVRAKHIKWFKLLIRFWGK